MMLQIPRRLKYAAGFNAQKVKLAISHNEVPAGVLVYAQRVLAVATASCEKSVGEHLECTSLQARYGYAVQLYAVFALGCPKAVS